MNYDWRLSSSFIYRVCEWRICWTVVLQQYDGGGCSGVQVDEDNVHDLFLRLSPTVDMHLGWMNVFQRNYNGIYFWMISIFFVENRSQPNNVKIEIAHIIPTKNYWNKFPRFSLPSLSSSSDIIIIVLNREPCRNSTAAILIHVLQRPPLWFSVLFNKPNKCVRLFSRLYLFSR